MSFNNNYNNQIELNEINDINNKNNSNNNNQKRYSQIENNLEIGSIHSSPNRTSAFTITRGYPNNNFDNITNNNNPDSHFHYPHNNNNVSNVPRTILSSTPVKDSPEYTKEIQKERFILLIILGIAVLFGPLVFRFCLGSPTSDNKEVVWGADLDSWEIYILLALFSSMIGFIVRLLPVLCGSPATINSVKDMKLEGTAALCLVSPFCAESDEMLFRNMLGRTCTLFHTVSSRHAIHGLYVDVTMNERRLKGESTRKNIYYEWIGFLATLIKIAQKNYIEKKHPLAPNSSPILSPILSQSNLNSSPHDSSVLENKYANETNFKKRFQSFRSYGESIFDLGRNSNIQDFVPTIVIDSADSIQLRRSTIRKSAIELNQLVHLSSNIPSNSTTTTTNNNNKQSPSFENLNLSSKNRTSKRVTIEIPTEQENKNDHDSQIENNFEYTNYKDSLFDNPKSDDRDVTNRTVLDGLTFDIESIEPVINFFDQWLSEMKLNERIYHYGDKNESLDRLFLAAPFMDHFEGEDLLAVHTALDRLYVAFTTIIPDDYDTKSPIYPDDIQEIEWTIKRKNSPNWSVVWSHIARSKLRPMTQSEIGDITSPPPLFDVVKIMPGAIVYCNNKYDCHPSHGVETFLSQRKKTYKVLTIRYENGIRVCDLTPFPPSPSTPDITWELDELYLLEMNRGKAGALNFCNEYFRRKTLYWTTKIHMTQQIQALVGIVDARHALVQPEVFWNDALPFFSSQKNTLAPSRSYGFGELHKFPICITVQYPQYFSNINDNDWLDNANSAYYNLWQPLRDCGKCVTSSGTNTIWDISDPNFIFCTDSRSEDLGTSHKYISDSVAVYLCSYVAYGIAKKTEDYLEALYRWSAGPLELMWLSLFEPFMLWNYFIVMIPCLLLALASFSPSFIWYYIYLVMIIIFILIGINDKLNQRKPLRKYIVATIICSNLWGWVGFTFSLTWVLILPLRVAIFGIVPFVEGQRWFFWGLITLVFGFPRAIFNDTVIRIARLSSPDARKLNLYKSLWRTSQLYACSFAYSLLSIFAGTYSAFKSCWYKRDLSLWSSFRVSGNEMDKAWIQVVNSEGISTVINYIHYCLLKIKYIISLTTSPTEMTKLFVTLLFICQVAFVVIGVSVTNTNNYIGALVVISSSSVNLAMIYQVAFLLQPNLNFLAGFPIRTELLYSFVGLAMIISAAVNRIMTLEEFLDALQIRPSIKNLND